MKTFKTFITEWYVDSKELRHSARHFQTVWFSQHIIKYISFNKLINKKSYYVFDKNKTYITAAGLNFFKTQVYSYLVNYCNHETDKATFIIDNVPNPNDVFLALLNNVRGLLGLKQLAGIK